MKVLLVENPSNSASPVRRALDRDPGLPTYVRHALSVAEACARLESDIPDVLLVMIANPSDSALHQLEQVCLGFPQLAVVGVLAAMDEEFSISAVSKGVQEIVGLEEVHSLPRVLRHAIERKSVEYAMRRSEVRSGEPRLRTIADNMPALIAYIDLERRYRYANKFHEEWLGRPTSELTGRTMAEVLGSECQDDCEPHVVKALDGQRVSFELRTLKNKFERFLRVDLIPEHDASGKVIGFCVLGNDITEAKLNEARLESIALYDPLTGLANRVLLADRVSQAIAHAQRRSTSTAIIFLDLDGFKEINDSHGHDIGDLILREAAERMVSTMRSEDTVARMGGDEFVVSMTHASTAAEATLVAEKLIATLSEPYLVRGLTLNLTASAGISMYPNQGENLDALLRSADQAMYEAKRAGKNAYRVYALPRKARA